MVLHFLPAGLESLKPIEITEALCWAIHGKPSADGSLWVSEDGETKIMLPVATEADAQAYLSASVHASGAILDALRQGQLSTYVQNPLTGDFMRVPRLYWLQRDLSELAVLAPVEGATGWDDAMVGQPVLVASQDVPNWEQVTRTALAILKAHPGGGQEQAELGEDRGAVISTTKAISDCAAWLAQEFQKPETRSIGRDEFKARALERYKERLSGRGFRIAWTRVVVAFPERKKPGPKAGA